MALVLSIENEARLPDGGPLTYRLNGRRGIDIGRDTHLDWTLPDPSRYISGKHCEIRYREGAYWLHDVSSNGTFVNRSDKRMQGPHRLRNGDRLEIGQYVIAVALEGEDASAADEPAPRSYDSGQLWDVSDEVAPPIHPAHLAPPPRERAPHPDFLDWAVDVPDAQPAFRPLPPPPARPREMQHENTGGDWFRERPPAPAPAVQPMASVPRPRRPATAAAELDFTPNAPERQPAPYPGDMPAWDADELPVAPAAPAGIAETAVEEATSAAPPPAEPPPSPAPSMELLQRFAKGAGIPENFFAEQDAGDVAEEIGLLMRIIAENLKQLLVARAESRGLMRSSSQTMVQALDNNPLKFSPTPEDALRIMFGPRTKSYLDARRTLQQSFDDIKAHQIDTYSAMQHALQMLLQELDPQTIDGATPAEGVLGAVVGSRKAKLWDAYVARWEAKTSRREAGLIDTFMLLFSECYQRSAKRTR